MDEKDYLEQKLAELKGERSQLTVLLKEGQVAADGKIDALIKASPLWEQIQAIKKDFEKLKDVLQRKNDHLSGKIEGLDALYDEFYRFAVAPGTVMYGVDISRLDWQMRARIMQGHRPSILLAGGDPDGPVHPPPPPPKPEPVPEPPKPVPAPEPVKVEPPRPQPPQAKLDASAPVSLKTQMAEKKKAEPEPAPPADPPPLRRRR